MSFEPINHEFIDTLESSGIIDAYEYVLRKLIEDNLPKMQVYEKCAKYLLEYQKLLLEKNIRAKNAQNLYKLSNFGEEKKQEIKAKEIIPTFPISLRSKLLLEQEANRPPLKVFETSIDELMRNKLNLLTKAKINEEMRSDLQGYGSYEAFVESENEKIRNYNFKIDVKFSNFQFVPLEEIEKMNQDEIDNLKDIPNNEDKQSSSKSESVSSKSITPSQASRIKKISKEVTNDLFKK